MANSTFEERKAALEQQRAQIMRVFAQGEAATTEESRNRNEKAHILILAAVLARATTNPAFYGVLLDVMDAEITKPADKEIVTTYLMNMAPQPNAVSEVGKV
jgi:hypothetical protein